jgi:hypothetical protein
MRWQSRREGKESVSRQKAWPKSAAALSNKLRRLAPNLGGVGIVVEFVQEGGTDSRKIIKLSAAKDDAVDASTRGTDCADGVGGVGKSAEEPHEDPGFGPPNVHLERPHDDGE